MSKHLLPVLVSIVVMASCSRSDAPGKPVIGNAQVQGHYDEKTGKLTSITYDSNKNGKIDTWSYMDGMRVLRIEIDKNEDGKVDRWEYYTPDQKLEKVGWSRANNGRPDAWGYQGPDGKMARIELANAADTVAVGTGLEPGARSGQPRIARTEFYENEILVRVEEDTNGDGKIDKWETWQNGVLSAIAFDSAARGTPDRRLVYLPDGKVKVEVDPQRTGEFKPARR